MSHAVTAARLHLLTWRSIVTWPWAVLASSLAINLLVYALLPESDRDTSVTWGITSIYVVVGVWAYQAISQVFGFALGMGTTRKAFAAGTGLVLAGQALTYALALTLLRYLEEATDGWGVQLHFFGVAGLAQDDPVTQLLVFAAPFLLIGAVLMAVAVVHHRWRQTGVLWLSVVVGLALGCLVALVTWLGAWHRLWAWAQDAPVLVTMVLLPVVAAVAVGAAGYRTLRRATP